MVPVRLVPHYYYTSTTLVLISLYQRVGLVVFVLSKAKVGNLFCISQIVQLSLPPLVAKFCRNFFPILLQTKICQIKKFRKRENELCLYILLYLSLLARATWSRSPKSTIPTTTTLFSAITICHLVVIAIATKIVSRRS